MSCPLNRQGATVAEGRLLVTQPRRSRGEAVVGDRQDATGAVGRLLVLQPRRSSSRICGRAGVSLQGQQCGLQDCQCATKAAEGMLRWK